MKERVKDFINVALNWLPKNAYFIRPDYAINWWPSTYIDNPHLAHKYQREVYAKAATLVKKHALSTVLDVGCGHGIKLNEFILPLTSQSVGVDLPEAIAYCQAHYTDGRWVADDIHHPTLTLPKPVELIISADVIEHLKNPDALFDYFKRFSNSDTWIVLSTPERDKVRGKDHFGPPPNKAHVREWNSAEFKQYAQSRGLRIIEQTLVNDVEGTYEDAPLRKFGKTCQMIIGKFV